VALVNSSIITASGDVVGTELAGGLALLDLRTGSYFNLNQTGAYVWSQIEGSAKTIGDILGAMTQAYDVSADVLEQDLQTLLTQLSEQGLIAVSA
jgi:Coenzyme PQQ synthesis protein D (PqqD)